MIFIKIEDRHYIEGLGAFGLQPFGLPTSIGDVVTLWDHLKSVYPYSPKNFAVSSGQEGPQAVLTWDPPEKIILRLMIRRKLKSYPSNPEDGILILDDITTASTRTSLEDCAASNLIRLLAETLNVGESSLLLEQSLNIIFAGQADPTEAMAEFFAAYETRYQVKLNAEYKEGPTSLAKLLQEAQTKDLLQGDQTSDSNWWYYRVFVQPERADIPGQFAGEGAQFLSPLTAGDPPASSSSVGPSDSYWLSSEFLDLQPYRNLTLVVENYSLNPVEVRFYTAPERPEDSSLAAGAYPIDLGWSGLGQSITLDAVVTGPGEDTSWYWGYDDPDQPELTSEVRRDHDAYVTSHMLSFSDLSLKFVGVAARNGLNANNVRMPWYFSGSSLTWDDVSIADLVKVYFIVNKNIYWQSNAYLNRPCLVFKTGRHQDIVWNRGHLPAVYVGSDEVVGGPPKQALRNEVVDRGGVAERINLYEEQDTRGPLYRFLKLMTLELDRSHHYLVALQQFNADVQSAPAEVLAHIAYELGWEVDIGRPLMDVRQELLRLAGLYKSKGTMQVCARVSSQQTKVTPRVQEGSGLVMRAANPDLF